VLQCFCNAVSWLMLLRDVKRIETRLERGVGFGDVRLMPLRDVKR
jgi:hypothetical protein